MKYAFRHAMAIPAAALVVTLAACGGGSGNASSSASGTSTGTTSAGGTDPVAALSAATATSLGATPLSTSSTQDVYDLTATIGDSWRLTVDTSDPAAPTFTINVQATQYALTSTSPSPVSKSVNGSFTTYTGQGLNVTVDTRTRIISGTVMVGGKSSSVTGTGYSVTDGTKLAGTYAYVGRTTDDDGSSSPYLAAGEFNIASTGTAVTVCQSGVFNGAGCTPVVNGPATLNLTMAYNSALPGFELSSNGQRVGIARVAAGDRGPVFLVDWYDSTLTSSPVTRTGLLGGVKLATLAGNEFNGSWVCTDGTTPTVSGTAVTAAAAQFALDYNKLPVLAAAGNSAIAFEGLAAVMSSSSYTGQFVLPMSAGLALTGTFGTDSLAVCAQQ
ncbi:hypothetical protein [Pararobbsia alpina]|uniref:Lipoprotein n=1 Tax=Pararobbsia alpina TaxID=621374 RepID=A0A6S7BMX6_9BURK|nr:hypothetical protein [Pararobbsia alpina]CAB3804627.1 hypothetical protein LMG28138_05546 [Pararobbsia alpina]